MGAPKDKIKQIYGTLPQLNCGLCGFDNCGKFAKAVAEGRASPFGCRQDPGAGYRISEIMGIKTPFFGSHHTLGRPGFTPRPGAPASTGSLGSELGELSRRIEGLLDRIDSLGRKRGRFHTIGEREGLRKEAIGMPRGDGTGPAGRGPGTGRGLGRGGGRGRMGGRSLGVGGECICPNCGHRVTHQGGTPCYQVRCPKCGSPMTR